MSNNPVPYDFYKARSAILAAVSDYPLTRNPDAGLTPAQQKKRRGENFMAPERLANLRVGPFMVEIATGVFMSNRMIGVTAFRLGGERESDHDECNACLHDLDELAAHLAKLAKPIQYQRGFSDYAAILHAAKHPEQLASEVTEEETEEMLGCVPPLYAAGVPGFLVGEAMTSDSGGTVYANYFTSRDGLPCARYHYLKTGK